MFKHKKLWCRFHKQRLNYRTKPKKENDVSIETHKALYDNDVQPSEISQRLHYFNLTNDWSVLQTNSPRYDIAFLYPEMIHNIDETLIEKHRRLEKIFGPLNEHYRQKYNEYISIQKT